ncbi:MAG TPA: serine hydrolase [Steroidobacteraceae bacterium]|nr:serine hydrolase [Steroidobacteraceae bacterium]
MSARAGRGITLAACLAALLPGVLARAAEPATPSSAGGEAQDAGRWSDELVGSAIRQGRFPGALAITLRGSQPPVIRAYGVSSIGRHDPIDPQNTLLQIGSISKLFTAILALQLVDEGRLDLDGSVSTYLKRFTLMSPELGPITIRDLMTHQGGFDSSLIGNIFADAAGIRETPRQMRRMLIRVRPAHRIPSYDNLGVDVLGLVIEDITGRSYAELLRRRIFGPLAMTHSIALLEPEFRRQMLDPDSAVQLAGCAVPTGTGSWESCRWLYSPARDAPAGGIFSSGADLARFLAALLAEGRYPGGRLLSAERWSQFVDFDQARLNPGVPGIGLLALQDAPVERGDWGHDGGGYGSVNTLYVSPRGGMAGFLGVTGGSKDTPLSLSGIVEYLRIDAAREEQLGAAYGLLKDFDRGIARMAAVPPGGMQDPTFREAPFSDAELSRLVGAYFSVRRASYAPILGRFLPAIMPWTQVTRGPDGSLVIDGQGPWRQSAPRLFEDPSGHRVAFQIRGDLVSMGSLTHSQLERHTLWTLPSLTVVPFFAAVLLALTGVVPALSRGLPRRARRIAGMAAIGGAVLLVSLAAEFEYGPDLYVADREIAALAFRVPMQAALLLLALVPVAYVVSRRAYAAERWAPRAHGAMLAAACGVSVLLAGYFGLIGHLSGV